MAERILRRGNARDEELKRLRAQAVAHARYMCIDVGPSWEEIEAMSDRQLRRLAVDRLARGGPIAQLARTVVAALDEIEAAA